LIIETIFYNMIDRKIGSIACLISNCCAPSWPSPIAAVSTAPRSGVSQQIKRFELETKRPLFRRTTRSVALTDDGEMLLGDARRLLQFEEAARHRLAAPRLSGSLRLGVGRGGRRRLSRALGTTPELWLKLQTSFDVKTVMLEMANELDLIKSVNKAA
jgi:DNA-binding transcriptional LysR family regulator